MVMSSLNTLTFFVTWVAFIVLAFFATWIDFVALASTVLIVSVVWTFTLLTSVSALSFSHWDWTNNSTAFVSVTTEDDFSVLILVFFFKELLCCWQLSKMIKTADVMKTAEVSEELSKSFIKKLIALNKSSLWLLSVSDNLKKNFRPLFQLIQCIRLFFALSSQCFWVTFSSALSFFASSTALWVFTTLIQSSIALV